MSSWRVIDTGETRLEVADWGTGEPIVFIQTAMTADELMPLARETAFDDGFRKVVYHRRGYAGSAAVEGPGSIVRDAADCAALLDAMGIRKAHVVGFSYSGAVGLQLAGDAPASVHTLTLVEPPPVHTPSSPEFRAINDRLIQSRHVKGPEVALDEFMAAAIGPNWQEVVATHLTPEMLAQAERDVLTFFDTDMPALMAWEYGPADVHRITCPVLYIGASDSGKFFAEVREVILEWFPQIEEVVIEDANHWLPVTHTVEVADAVASFVSAHPM